MQPLSLSRTLFGVLFLFALVAGAVVNAYFNGKPVLNALTSIPEHGAADGQKRADAAARKNVLGQYAAMEARSRILTAFDKWEMNNFSIIKGPDGHLYPGGFYVIDTANARKLAKSIKGLDEIAREKETPLLYLAAPDLVPKGGVKPPENMPVLDFNVAIDGLLYSLRERTTPAVDTRYVYLSRGFPLNEIVPKTAQALTGEAAFALFDYLLEALEKEFGLKLDPDGYFRDRSHYKVEKYPNFFMGSLGHRSGSAFGGLDDFTAVSPDFETEFTLVGTDIFGAEISVEGDATKTILKPDALKYYSNLYTLFPYSYYTHTNLSRSIVTNVKKPDGPKILLVNDFYTAQLATLLAPLCSELHTLTYHENQPQSAEDYIADKNFDAIVISFFPPNILRPESQGLILNPRPEDDEADEIARP